MIHDPQNDPKRPFSLLNVEFNNNFSQIEESSFFFNVDVNYNYKNNKQEYWFVTKLFKVRIENG